MLQRVKTEEASFPTFIQCPECPDQLKGPLGLKQHLKVHRIPEGSKDRFMCGHCFALFHSRYSRNVHLNRVHGKNSVEFNFNDQVII